MIACFIKDGRLYDVACKVYIKQPTLLIDMTDHLLYHWGDRNKCVQYKTICDSMYMSRNLKAPLKLVDLSVFDIYTQYDIINKMVNERNMQYISEFISHVENGDLSEWLLSIKK